MVLVHRVFLTAFYLYHSCSAGPVVIDRSVARGFQPLKYSVKTTLIEALEQFLGVPSDSHLVRLNYLLTKRQTHLIKFQQVIGDVVVYDSVVVAETNKNEIVVRDVTAFGLVKNVNQSLPRTATINASQAIEATAAAFNVTANETLLYAWNVQAKLNYYREPSGMRLSYLVDFFIHRPQDAEPFAPHAVVDATTQQILLLWNGIAAQTVTNINGVGGNMGSNWGIQWYTDIPATRQSDGVTCTFSTPDVRVQNMRSSTSGPFVDWSFPCKDAANATADAVNGGYSPLNDVVRHSKATLDAYVSYLDTPPTLRTPLLARVHYGSSYENAFWDGSQINVGDGGSNFFPIASVDVVAHEFSHAFTAKYSALQYSEQSGGINEAFSDMGGEVVEYYLTNKNDFLVGEKFVKSSGLYVRNMCDPTVDGKSIDNANNFVRGMDPHYSSGVYNKAFCILAKTWDVVTAFQIFGYANAVFWRQQTSFTEGACGVQKAAEANGLSVSDVAAAFSAVGVRCS